MSEVNTTGGINEISVEDVIKTVIEGHLQEDEYILGKARKNTIRIRVKHNSDRTNAVIKILKERGYHTHSRYIRWIPVRNRKNVILREISEYPVTITVNYDVTEQPNSPKRKDPFPKLQPNKKPYRRRKK